jgi:hypothetical protein
MFGLTGAQNEKVIIYPCTLKKDNTPNVLTDQKFEVDVNPESYTINYDNDYNREQANGSPVAELKYSKTLPQQLQMDFLFDSTGVLKQNKLVNISLIGSNAGGDLIQRITDFKKALFDYSREEHQPNYIKLHWGTLTFFGRLTSLNINYKLFQPDGKPIRAVASCGFIGKIDEDLQAAFNDQSSPDLTHQRTVTAGSNILTLTQDIYNDEKYYYAAAKANQLNSFRKIKTGTVLNFPPVK